MTSRFQRLNLLDVVSVSRRRHPLASPSFSWHEDDDTPSNARTGRTLHTATAGDGVN